MEQGNSRAWMGAAALLAAGLAGTVPAQAQYAGQPGIQPGGQQMGQQQGQQGGQPGGLSIAGLWSGRFEDGTPTQFSVSYGTDGTYLEVQGAPGAAFMVKNWGWYQTRQVGPDTLQIERRKQGYMPMRTCMQSTGQCQPIPVQMSDTGTIVFTSANSYRMGAMVGTRTNDPGLLRMQAQVPAQVMAQEPAPAPYIPTPYIPAPSAPVVTPYRPMAPSFSERMRQSDNLQQQRVCRYSDGFLSRDRNGNLHCD